MYQIKAYHCDYCKKYGKYKGNIVAHEKKCFHNPDTRSCATCLFLKQEKCKRMFLSHEIDDLIPICTAGYNISVIEGESKKVNMRTECEMWINKNE